MFKYFRLVLVSTSLVLIALLARRTSSPGTAPDTRQASTPAVRPTGFNAVHVLLGVLVGAGVLTLVALAAACAGWNLTKAFMVFGAAQLAVGALLQAWRSSSSSPTDSNRAELLDYLGWLMVCSGASFALVAAIMA